MAHFKTGCLQREQVLDVKVAADLKVGDLAAIDASSGALKQVSSLANADYIIAQSDMTMEYGHVPVENNDHRYSDKVAASTAPKKVAVFYIIDKTDILLDQGETK